jgi:hypothetical protein
MYSPGNVMRRRVLSHFAAKADALADLSGPAGENPINIF